MLKKAIILHVLPFIISCIIVTVFLFTINQNSSAKSVEHLAVQAASERGRLANLSSLAAQDDFLESIQNPNQITLFGSSEFSESPYCSYYFLPDSINQATLGIGHEGHQHLPIFTELLFAYNFIKNSKTAIIISPTWFETEGTHPEAFLEFAEKNVLATILKNKNIHDQYKAHIGKYVYKNQKTFLSLSNEMESLMDIYATNTFNPFLNFTASIRQFMKQKYGKRYAISSTTFPMSTKTTEQPIRIKFDYSSNLNQAQTAFKIASSNNNLHIDNKYYNEYVLKSNGDIKRGNLEEIEPETNTEFADFQAVVNLLHESGANASFIILPINTFYYKEPTMYLPLITALETEIIGAGFPVLNLYTSDTSNYEPGVLKDIMHLGDYGWLKVNQFLDSVYHD